MGKFNQIRVVVPTFNEAENITKLTSALFDLPLDGLSILVVDDNSPDGTGQIADELSESFPGQFSVLHRKGKKGLGSAYIEGFGQALDLGADAIVQMDADFSHPPEIVVDLIENLADSDVVMGSRYIPGGSVDEQWPIWRKGLSEFGNIYAKSILQLPINDATGGFKAWRRETLLAMPLDRVRSNGYAFQVEMIYLAFRSGCKILEVPFYFADRKWGTSKMSLSIQIEAAYRVWQMLYEYRDIKATVNSNSRSLPL
jgi:dolichol-phosphate mannosyltransferase